MYNNGYRVPARRKILGTDGYRVPALKKFLGTRYRENFHLCPGRVSIGRAQKMAKIWQIKGVNLTKVRSKLKV